MARQYAAFISYRHRPLDIAVAMKVHKCIERFKIPGDLRREEKKNPGSVCKNWEGAPPEKLVVFRDRDELPLSNDLTSDIFDALDNAKCLIVICTPDTPKSLWVRREISHFIEKHGRKRIITVLAAGTPEESIPREITTRYAEDGVTVLEEFEPLVAYLVDDSQKKVLKNMDKERLRICAAILGCPYDSLKQRHKRRRMQQLLAASAAAFLVALTFIGMLVNRNQEISAQKREVEAQKRQVEEQKLRVEEQKRMTQLRESELLTADAREALNMGNIRDAIERAVAALPKAGEEDRPYYAPAEAVLMEAMDVLGGAGEQTLISDRILEQMTPIAHFCLMDYGKLAITIDEYGVVNCFDTATGEKLWSEIVAVEKDSSASSYITFSADGTALVCYCDDALEGREPETGRLLWHYSMRGTVPGYFICDNIRNRIAVLRDYQTYEEGYLLELEVISAVTGQMEQNIRLEQSEKMQRRTIHNTAQTRLPTGGVFSEDGRYYACAFARDHEEKGKSWLDCFVVDLQEGAVVTHYTQEVSCGKFYVTWMEFREDGLLMTLEVDDHAVAGSMLKLDWQEGKLLWQTTTPAELENQAMIYGDLTSRVLFWENAAFLGRYEKLYCIDLQTGEILGSAQLPGTLSTLRTVSDSYFAFSLEEGTYAIGWFNRGYGFTLTTDNYLQVTASVGAHSQLLPYGGGIVQRFTDGNYLEISVSNVDRPGYLAIVPEDNESQLIIRRPVTVEKTTAAESITVPVEYKSLRSSNAGSVMLRDGTLILGQFCGRDEEWNYHYFYLAMDPGTHEVKQVIQTEDTYYKQYFFLPDGSGYLSQDREGIVMLVQNGKESVLAERIDPHHGEDRQSIVRGMVQTDSVYLSDGTVLTAHSDTQNITLLKDGVEVASAVLPESHRYSEDMEIGVQRYIQAGRNGFLVTHLTRLLQNVSATDVAFYDTAKDVWIQPELAAPLTNTNSYAFAEAMPYFAAVDAEHMVRVLELGSGEEIASFPLQLPGSSVMHMDFLLEDSCLMVKTQDAKVLIFELATGEILLQDQLDTTFSGSLTAWEDPVAGRLYILDSNTTGTNALCIDLSSWTVLSRAKNVVGYIPRTGELYQTDSSYGATEFLFAFRIPDTAELVRLAQQMLEAQ